MKRVWVYILVLCVAISAMVISCKKSSDQGSKVSDAAALSSLLGSLHAAPYTLSVQAGKDAIVYCARSTRLHFYPNSFKDGVGRAVSSGTVAVTVTEVYNTSDLISHYINTGTTYSLFGCSGAVNIEALINGQPVYADRYSIGFTQPEASNKSAQLFYGYVGADSLVSWSQNYFPNSGTSAASTSIDGSGSNFYRYQLDSCTSFNWVCCGRLAINTAPKTNVQIVLPDTTFNALNTRVFIVLPDDKIIVSATIASAGTFTLLSGALVPTGASYEIVVLAAKKGVYYYAQSTGTVTDGLTLHPSLMATAKENIMSALVALR